MRALSLVTEGNSLPQNAFSWPEGTSACPHPSDRCTHCFPEPLPAVAADLWLLSLGLTPLPLPVHL